MMESWRRWDLGGLRRGGDPGVHSGPFHQIYVFLVEFLERARCGREGFPEGKGVGKANMRSIGVTCVSLICLLDNYTDDGEDNLNVRRNGKREEGRRREEQYSRSDQVFSRRHGMRAWWVGNKSLSASVAAALRSGSDCMYFLTIDVSPHSCATRTVE